MRHNNFVVFCEARTGSYNLVSRLNSCSDAVCHGEVFKKNRIEIGDFQARRLKGWTIEERNRRPGDFLAELRAINPFRHFGFKLFAGHIGWAPGVLDYLLAPETRRVILVRPALEIYASGLRARQTGIWTNPSGRKPPKDRLEEKVRFTPESFDSFALHYNRYIAMCRMLAALPGSFVIHYAQTGDAAAMNALLGFVGSTSGYAETSSEYRKQYGGGLADGFENWDELEAARDRLAPIAEAPPPSHPLAGTAPAARAAAPV